MTDMIMRPADESGDMLPVIEPSSLLRGIQAEAQLSRNRLDLLSGDWWENPAWGNEALEMLKGSRLTEADTQAVASYITSFIRETPDVRDVRDVVFFVDGRQFRYACVMDTDSGTAEIRYEQ